MYEHAGPCLHGQAGQQKIESAGSNFRKSYTSGKFINDILWAVFRVFHKLKSPLQANH